MVEQRPIEMKNLLPNILVTGTPGVGKTSLCSLLEAQLPEDYDLTGF
jgi:nucleoside-triphosphatase THEP1